MKIITISREFGSGGRELGRRLSDILGFDYYDKEILAHVVENKGLGENYVETILEGQGWKNIPITYRSSFAEGFLQPVSIDILQEQNRIIEEIADMGKDFIMLGRNADLTLKEYNPFNMFVCADMESKLKRCRERGPEDEDLSEKELRKRISRMDKDRMLSRSLLRGQEWGRRDAYHLTVNTTGWNMINLSAAVAEFAEKWFESL